VVECPECGTHNPEGTQFCANQQCGAYLGFVTAVHQAVPGAAAPPPDRPVTQPTASVIPGAARTASGAPSEQRYGVNAALQPDRVAVEPGAAATATVTVHNTGCRVEEFRLAPDGPAAGFISVDPPVLQVYPDSRETATVQFTPTRGPESPAGDQPYTIRVQSSLHAGLTDAVHGIVTVAPFEQLEAALRPDSSRGRGSAVHRISLANRGNTPLNVHVELSDRDGVLQFAPQSTTMRLGPGEGGSVPVRVTGPKRWFGRVQPHSFSTQVTVPGGAPPTLLPGVRHQVPVFPWWIPTAIVILIALLIAFVGVFLRDPQVPAVRGLPSAQAQAGLLADGFVARPQPLPDEAVAAGLAVGTEPPAGERLKKGSVVVLIVSSGPADGGAIEVPVVDGLAQEPAQRLLKGAGFRVARVNRVANQDFEEGLAVGTAPPGGTARPPGSEVVLAVSAGAAGAGGGGAALPDLAASTDGVQCRFDPSGSALLVAVNVGFSGALPGAVAATARTDTGAEAPAQVTAGSPAGFTLPLGGSDLGQARLVEVTVDPGNGINEADEGNNKVRVRVEIPSDLPQQAVSLECSVERG